MKTALFVLLDQYADWEAAPLASVVNRTPGWRVTVVAPGGNAVRSIGGMSWRSEAAKPVESPVRAAIAGDVPVGAICDATVFLGKLGVLNAIPHTGNLRSDLQGYAGPDYAGSPLYRNEPAVRSGRIVTANGTAALDFAREILVALGILDEEDASKWYRLFKSGFLEAGEEAAWWFSR